MAQLQGQSGWEQPDCLRTSTVDTYGSKLGNCKLGKLWYTGSFTSVVIVYIVHVMGTTLFGSALTVPASWSVRILR